MTQKQSEIQQVSDIQDFLFEITTDNLQEHIDQMNQKFDLHDKNTLRHVLASSGIVFHIRPSVQKSLIQLLLSISSIVQSQFTPHELYYIFCLDLSNYFLYELISNKILTFPSIFSIPHNENPEFLSYFAPELETYDITKFNEIKTSLEFELDKHEELRSNGVNHSEIAKIIREDQIDLFIEFISRSESEVNGQIPDSIFEGCHYLKSKPSFIEYAAFFGSVQIFQHILNQNVQLTNGVTSYAVMGGNLNIIHLCQEHHLNFDNAIDTALIFHRNDVLNYFLDNSYAFTNYSPLACIEGYNYSYFYQLFNDNCDKNRLINNCSDTPLIYSTKHLYPEFAVFISSLSGVDFNRVDDILISRILILFYTQHFHGI